MRGIPYNLVVILLLAIGSTVPALAQSATISGHVTSQSTGAPISGAAIVAEGNQTGTRVAVTDAQGNYTLPVGANTNIKLRAYKSTFTFNPVLVGISSVGGFPIVGSITRDFAGTSFPILVFALPPVLLTEDNSLNALALDDVIRTRDPFSLNNENYFGSDKRTRLNLFLVDLDLFTNSGETLSIITAQATDAQAKTYALVVEDLRKVPGAPWMSQLTVRLPGELAGVTEATLTVTARGQVSNGAKIKLK